MKNIYTFGRKPGQRNYTVKDLQELKQTGQRLTMCNPANEGEIRACVDAGIDTLTVWDRDMELARALAPTHFIGTAMGWGQLISHDEILRHAMGLMEAGADMYFTNRSLPVVEMLAREGIPCRFIWASYPPTATGAGACVPGAGPPTRR